MPKRNIYRSGFTAGCPNNDESIDYRLEIESDRTIMVEEIVAFTDAIERGYQENIADDLYEKFGGRQRIEAHHHGVDIETIRGTL